MSEQDYLSEVLWQALTHRLTRTEGTWPCWAHCGRLGRRPPPPGHRNGLQQWESDLIPNCVSYRECWGGCPRRSCSPGGPPPPPAGGGRTAWRRRRPCSGEGWASRCGPAAGPRYSGRWSAPAGGLQPGHINTEWGERSSPFSIKLRMYPRCSSETTSLFHLSCFSRRLFKV